MAKVNGNKKKVGSYKVKAGLAQMLKGGVIMDVVTVEHAKIAEEAAKDQNEPIGVSRMNIAQAMDHKRKLTRDGRFDPTPRGKYG